MADGFIQVFPDQSGKKVDNAIVTRGGVEFYRQRVETYPSESVGLDTGGRQRVSQMTTLFDGKTLAADDPLMWDTTGTGTATFDRNLSAMTVTAGQFVVRQGRFFTPYFSGKPQLVEATFDGFGLESGVVKRVGYFSSGTASPFVAEHDGWWLESHGIDGTYYLVVANRGVETLRLAWTDWSGYGALAGYDWDTFTVILADFLWLGGAALRLYVKNPDGGFVEAHVFDYAGSTSGVFMDNPQQPVRYEIRSTTGAGALRAICSQVATEGSLSERGQSLTTLTAAPISCASTSSIYPLKGIRKAPGFRNAAVRVDRYALSLTTTNARGGMLYLLLSPTLSAPLSYAGNSRILDATGNGTITVTALGRVLSATPVDLTAGSAALTTSALSELPVEIDGTAPEVVLAYQPASNNQQALATLSVLEY